MKTVNSRLVFILFLGVYLKRTCSLVTSASSSLGVFNDYALYNYKSTQSCSKLQLYIAEFLTFIYLCTEYNSLVQCFHKLFPKHVLNPVLFCNLIIMQK